jgi:DNA polymerase-3 subunit delta
MKLPLDQLAGHMQGALAPAYLISGDEPLLVGEAADAIRARARALGHSERDVWFVERSMDWSAVRMQAGSMSLFGERRIIEIRLTGAKPGKDGGATIAGLCESAASDTVVLILSGRIDGDARATAWFKAVERHGVWVPVEPVGVARLPAWLGARCRKAGLELTDDALQLLADRVEGNLLAAHQEIEKLRLLASGQKLDAAQVLAAVADSSRFDVFQLGEAALSGDTARALRIVDGLRAEGVEPTLVLWSLARELRNLWAERASGTGAPRHRPWSPPAHVAALDKARRRLSKFPFARLNARALRADRMIKGRMAGEPWDEIQLLAAEFCGVRPVPLPAARGGL